MKKLSVDSIRSTFSKAGISINGNLIFALYSYKSRWFSQYMDGNSKEIFLNLLKLSNEFHILCTAGKSIVLRFVLLENTGTKEYYLPVELEMSLDDLREIAKSVPEDGENSKFFEIFSGVDLENENEVIDAFLKLLSGKDVEETLNFNADIEWREIEKIATEFCLKHKFDYNLLPPDPGESGSFIIYFPENSSFSFDGEELESFIDLIFASNDIEFEGETDTGILNLVLYS